MVIAGYRITPLGRILGKTSMLTGPEEVVAEDVFPVAHPVDHLGILKSSDHPRYERGAEGELPQIAYL